MYQSYLRLEPPSQSMKRQPDQTDDAMIEIRVYQWISVLLLLACMSTDQKPRKRPFGPGMSKYWAKTPEPSQFRNPIGLNGDASAFSRRRDDRNIPSGTSTQDKSNWYKYYKDKDANYGSIKFPTSPKQTNLRKNTMVKTLVEANQNSMFPYVLVPKQFMPTATESCRKEWGIITPQRD